ncbi:tetratricopeptide repeat protein [Trichophyton tonsurans CBS 112818]|uniref:Tetratricopeptide repeat protein n=1 Tax=Trichophyton tonsurans (strain CBS 112818) TaxID=647933 RepID=F2RWD0_TRIT1|nr:tetratricopeptide repeat protein [Trichophyton tonsurans CBS 112818]
MPDTLNDKHNESDGDEEVFHDARFPPDEEADLLRQSHSYKADANTLFSASNYSEAITTYDRALAVCPNYLDYEVAVLKSNIAACHIKLEEWESAVDAATSSITFLDRLASITLSTTSHGSKGADTASNRMTDATPRVVELPEDTGQRQEEEALRKLKEKDTHREDVLRIRGKSLMRRAKARMQLGGWANLQGAEEDYKSLLELGILPPHDTRAVKAALSGLPAKINAAKDKEMAEMMGKLKDLGNRILKPFGLSTDNFKFVKDEKTGGYSMGFEK